MLNHQFFAVIIKDLHLMTIKGALILCYELKDISISSGEGHIPLELSSIILFYITENEANLFPLKVIEYRAAGEQYLIGEGGFPSAADYQE